MPSVKDDAALASLAHVVCYFFVGVEQGDVGGIEVRVDVPWTHALEQFLVRASGLGGKVDHGDGVALSRRLDCATCRLPTWAAKVGRLGADNVLAVLLNRRGAERGIHFADILLGSTDHASTDDIDKGQDAGLGGIDDGALEIGHILPSSTACIYYGSYAVGQSVLVGEEPALISSIDVDVDIDQAWGDIETGHIDDLCRIGFNSVGDRSD